MHRVHIDSATAAALLTLSFAHVNGMKIAVGQTASDGAAQRRQRQTIAREALAHDDAGHEDERLQLAALDRLLTRRVEDADTARLLQRVATRFYAKQTQTRTIINCYT